ncbi:MAG: hypothetical protein CM15mP21_0610 [Hyphomicrobiales bacterium]|nr:MAG: hypothetical protein CM15mP21_0610 [Hyphomicrobiales bacterium]
MALAEKLFEEIIKGRLTRRGRAGVDGLAGRNIDHGGHQAFCEIGKSVRNAARQRRGRKPQRVATSITDRECRKKDEKIVIANLFSIYQPDQHHAGNQSHKTTEAKLCIIDHVELTHNTSQKCRKKGIDGALKSQYSPSASRTVSISKCYVNPRLNARPFFGRLLFSRCGGIRPKPALRFRGTAHRSGFCHRRSAC